MTTDKNKGTSEPEEVWDETFGAWVLNPKEQVQQHEDKKIEEEEE